MHGLNREPEVKGVVAAQMPEYQVDSIVRLGEGQHNIAYLVNDELIVRFGKAAERAAR